jgi:large subunit ribosomal protein L23|uniref:ribosomal protein L23 n=1 Tax=Scapania undulata TaxID=215256 RepID=UPI001F143C32|nr:ribosomal protein L23 [Scapania undulata]UKT60665.1 ribosomal protein L23 [Scapania undulata]
MDKIEHPVLTEKTIRLLEKNQYSFDVDVRSNKTEMKKWIELFFNVKVIGINSHRLPRKGKKMGAMSGYTTQYKRMIITLKSGYSIPLFSSK